MIKKFFKNHSIHKKIVPSFDYVFLFRPTLFFAVWVMICIGMYLAHLEFDTYPQWISTINTKTVFLFISLTFLTGATFITNQLADIDSDLENKKLFIIDNIINKENAKKAYQISLLIGFILIIFTNFYNALIGLFIFLIWDVLYNNEKFKLRNNPILGPVCNLSVGILLILSGWLIVIAENNYFFSVFDTLSFNFIIKILSYGICFLSVVLLTDIPDKIGDEKFGKKSFSIIFGRMTTNIVAFILVLISFCLGIYLNDPLLSISTICSIPFFLYAIIRNKDKDVLRAIRYPIFILNFFASTIYPYLFLITLIIFYLSKYYYWHRFNLHYPTFLVNND